MSDDKKLLSNMAVKNKTHLCPGQTSNFTWAELNIYIYIYIIEYFNCFKKNYCVEFLFVYDRAGFVQSHFHFRFVYEVVACETDRTVVGA